MPTSYRADQVGSFLRPPALRSAHAAHAEGRLPLDELRALEDEAILSILDLQRQAGIDVFSDGEYRRSSWSGGFREAVDGYVTGAMPIVLTQHQPDGAAQSTAAAGAGQEARVIGAPVRQRRRLTAHESSFLTAHAPGPCKVTMPAPSYIVARSYAPGITDKVYPSRAALFRDVSAIIHDEITALIAEGVPYIQLDDPHYTDYISEEMCQRMRAAGVDPDQALAEDIAGDNAAIAGFDRSKATIAMHLCRGNGPVGNWHIAGGYEAIAERVFQGLQVDRFLLEYDSARAGGFAPLRFMPRDTQVVLGLVTTKSGTLETPEVLRARIAEAAQLVDLDRLAVSPQCGFASVATGHVMTPEEQRRKLELVVHTARAVWG